MPKEEPHLILKSQAPLRCFKIIVSKKRKVTGFLLVFFTTLLILSSCSQRDPFEEYRTADHFLNLNDTVDYVGMKICKGCHPKIYNEYIKTGMGQSFDTASPRKSAAVIGKDSILYDPCRNFYYQPFWKDDTLMVREFRKASDDTVYERNEMVNYVVGSGQHTNSHIYLSAKYAYQVPFTYYTQEARFDFPPGFEGCNNSRFSRKIGLECMSCHNGFPDFVMGSENKYDCIPDGIDCERCHGPGEVHVALKKKGFIVDTSLFVDHTIVNPANLPLKLQSDVCARCHLQGTMVLKPGKSFYDFRPGMTLTSVMDIFMPVYEGGNDDFIMASHYERMVQSQCYIRSKGGFSCIGCHDPHISHLNTPKKSFNRICHKCHNVPAKLCTEKREVRKQLNDDCTTCHMPLSFTRDIPHVRIHDHKIAVPGSNKSPGPRSIKGLVSVNNPYTDNLTKARGYIREFETYQPVPKYLDSAQMFLDRVDNKEDDYYFNAVINYYFLKSDFSQIANWVNAKGIRFVIDSLINKQDYSNYDAWTAYRIGQAYENTGDRLISGYFYKQAVSLAPFNLEFQNKYGSGLVSHGKYQEAIKVYEFIVKEDPNYTAAWANLSTVMLQMNRLQEAKQYAGEALRLNPDHLQALINLAGIYLYEGNDEKFRQTLAKINSLDPDNPQVKEITKRLR